MSRAIGKRLLVCTATAYKSAGLDADRNPAWGEPTELRRIWVTRSISQTTGTAGKQADDTMTLFFDCKTSEPIGYTFDRNMRIDYQGESYLVQTVTPCPCPTGIHHYEVTLK